MYKRFLGSHHFYSSCPAPPNPYINFETSLAVLLKGVKQKDHNEKTSIIILYVCDDWYKSTDTNFAHDLLQMDEDKILSDKERMSPAEAVSDAIMAIVAGYDTTATVLTGILYYVIKNPHVYARLREELDEHFQKAGGDSLNSSRLGELPYLSAVMFVYLLQIYMQREKSYN